MNVDEVWKAALGELQLEMTRATFDTWVRPNSDHLMLGLSGTTLSAGNKALNDEKANPQAIVRLRAQVCSTQR